MKAICLLLSISLLGCGEIAYKRGGSADDLATAQQQCRKQITPEGYAECMRTQGWEIHKPDAWAPLAVVVPNPDNRSVGEPVYVPVAGSSKANAAPDRSVPPDPLTKFTVSSWWKAGSGADDLKAATDACVARLGPAHKPESATLMTRGLILCVKEYGWQGLQG